VVFGSLAETFQHFFEGTLSHELFSHDLAHFVLYFVYLGVAQFITVYIGTVGFIYTGDHISTKIREQYLASILRQNIAFFDNLGAGEITTRVISDTTLIQDGMSEKVAITLGAISTFISAFVIGYIKYWKLAVILSATVVTSVLIMGGGARFIVANKKKSLDAYALGGTVAEEVLNSIKTTTAFGTRDKLANKYGEHLFEAEKWSFKTKTLLAVMISCYFCIMYLNYVSITSYL
jgi:ATP-binding cassette subfamily B (MDR/TAP) protein 1